MKRLFKSMLPLVMLAGLVACGQQTPGADNQASVEDSAPAFRILAGSELKDVADKVVAYGQSQGVTVQFDYTGSLDAIDRLSETNKYDAVWLSHGKYLQLTPQVKSMVKASEKTMYSRVVLGVKPEKMRELKWESGKTSWKDIVAATKAGKFHFAMTNPTGSNTGFVTLVGLASELAGKGDALQAEDIPSDELKKFFSGHVLTSGSSGTLAESFVAQAQSVDGMFNYESVIRSVSAQVPLEVLIPKEGIITADYPLMLLAQSQQAPFYEKLVAFLRSPEAQKDIVQATNRTPLTGNGSDEVVNELPFPGSLKVVDAILKGFLDDYSRPASSYFVLDVSGSMEGERLDAMKNSMQALVRGDGTVSGRFATIRSREKVALTAFSSTVDPVQEFTLTDSADTNRQALDKLGLLVAGLKIGGGTAIYDALLSIYDKAQGELRAGGRMVSIVLLTDGENNNGANLQDFLAHVEAKGSPRVPVHAILYGEGNVSEMTALAQATGGKTFDARKMSLKQVMKAIRAYQ